MTTFMTKYGELSSVSIFDTYPDDRIKECILTERIELNTPLGVLGPQYEYAGVRRKQTCSISFFRNGNISKIALNEQTVVDTPIGRLPAELVTFYESGRLKRLFPLNGQINGYWDEDDEYGLSKELGFSFKFGSIKTKIIGIAFYENGSIWSLTLWPKETVTINTPTGEHKVRIGFSLYSDGSIKSIEPAVPINVLTQLGNIKAFDITANGISGDTNSLNFNTDGSVKSLITSNTKISVISKYNPPRIYSPMQHREMPESELYFQALKIEFAGDTICFNGQDEYKLSDNQFVLEPYFRQVKNLCSDCSSCKGCSS